MAYRPTMFDRHGAEAADFANAFRGAFVAGGLFGVYGGARYALEHDFNPVIGGLVGGVGLALVSWFAIVGVSRIAGASFSAFIQPQGTYEETFSYEESLLARGNHAEAIASFERHAAEGTGGAHVLLRAADLHAQQGNNPARAAELYRRVQRTPNVSPANHLYATNRLIDLYTGPLANPEAAISELRRLIAAYPRSDAAKHARTALVSLKRQLRSESDG